MKLGGIKSGTTTNGTSEEKKEYAPIPDGTYPVKLLELNFNKQSKSSSLIYNEATLVITEGEFAGRRVWEKFAVKNGSPKHIDVSRQRFERLAKATVGAQIAKEIISGQRDVEDMLEKELSVVLTTKGKYTNVKQFLAV